MTQKGIIESVFWGHVSKSAEPDGCWMWTGPKMVFKDPTKLIYGTYGERGGAHRVSYELALGPIPDGLEIDHLCRVPLCVNPAHLEAVTHAENIRRKIEAMTHCKRAGHPLTPDNTVRGTKSCATCARENALAYYYRVRRSKMGVDPDRLNRECRNGHPRTDENTYVSPKGQRYCLTCRRGRDARARRAA